MAETCNFLCDKINGNHQTIVQFFCGRATVLKLKNPLK